MEFKYSRLIDPSEYETQDLCEGIPLRMHKQPQHEDIGTIRCQRDWSRLVKPLKHYKGGLHAQWNFMSTSVPECLPDRLEIISYCNELAFLYDDDTEDYNENQLEISNNTMQDAFLEGAVKGSISVGRERADGMREIQGLILNEMMAIDKERAITTMKAWVEFLKFAGGRQHQKHFATLEEYIPYRSIDVGKWFWYGLVTFGMAITIPPAELDKMEELMTPAWSAAALQNDVFSWEKERDAAIRYGGREVVNAVYVLMGEHSIGEQEAMAKLRETTKAYVKEYVEVVERELGNETLSTELRKYMEAVLYSLSGNVVWALSCPRYNPGKAYNKSQLALMDWEELERSSDP